MHACHFVNQDLDPYLHRIYDACGAAPLVAGAQLINSMGGDTKPRYKRVAAQDWRGFASEAEQQVVKYVTRRNRSGAMPPVHRLVRACLRVHAILSPGPS